MPLKPGSSKATQDENFHELSTGKTHAHTEAKFGKRDADKQMVAIVLKSAGKSNQGKRGEK